MRAAESLEVGRTAPSASGPPHLGTLFSAMLALWQARSHGARAIARIEDLDVLRVRPEYVCSLRVALDAIGYRHEDIVLQSERSQQHAQALSAFAAEGRLYACSCPRARRKQQGRALAGGSIGYDNACRRQGRVGPETWRSVSLPLRLAMPAGRLPPVDVDAQMQHFCPDAAEGDPIVRRKDGTVAYVFASVVDDVAAGVTQVVRGRDLLALTPQQVGIAHLLQAPIPSYRHHALLLGPDGKKLSKSCGDGTAWSTGQVRAMCAALAAHLAQSGVFASRFAWQKLPRQDIVWPAQTPRRKEPRLHPTQLRAMSSDVRSHL